MGKLRGWEPVLEGCVSTLTTCDPGSLGILRYITTLKTREFKGKCSFTQNFTAFLNHFRLKPALPSHGSS